MEPLTRASASSFFPMQRSGHQAIRNARSSTFSSHLTKPPQIWPDGTAMLSSANRSLHKEKGAANEARRPLKALHQIWTLKPLSWQELPWLER